MIKSLLLLALVLPIKSFALPSLLVGLGSSDITPEVGAPLGGYGGSGRRLKLFLDWGNRSPLTRYLKPSNGVLDPIRSKAMVVQSHNSKILFISIDAVGVTSNVYEELRNRLKHLKFSEMVITATHTHSGPGALTKSFLWQVMAMDKFQKSVYEGFINGIVDSVETANSHMVPATLHTSEFMAREIHKNRRDRPENLDSEAKILLAKNTAGEIIGGFVNFPIHGCALNEENLMFSADVAGGIERHLEKLISKNQSVAPTILFINGAEGDVSNVHRGADGIEIAGGIFAEKAAPAIANLRDVEPVISYSSVVKKLDKARINLKKCDATKKEIKIPVSNRMLPRAAKVWHIKLGDIYIMSFPGEPTTDIGLAAKAMAHKYGIHNPWVFGLTNGHMGYFVTPQQYEEGGYETCVAFHGKNAGANLLEAHEQIFKLIK